MNDQPTGILLNHSSVPENSPPGTVIGTLSSVDEDKGQTHVYSVLPFGNVTDSSECIQRPLSLSLSLRPLESSLSLSLPPSLSFSLSLSLSLSLCLSLSIYLSLPDRVTLQLLSLSVCFSLPLVFLELYSLLVFLDS